jgi:hypothetical protein
MFFQAIRDKLAHYEDLEEAGRLIIAKYGKGQRVYEADAFKDEVLEYEITDHEVWHDVELRNSDTWGRMCAFGEGSSSVFATKSEAEAKLAEMEKEHE